MNLNLDSTRAPRRPLARRLAVLLGAGGFVAALVLGTGATSWAAPTKGDVWTLSCGDVSVTVQLTPGGGDPVWGEDGTMYHQKSFEVRIYRGEFATEPDIDPIVQFSKSLGNRTGQGEATECSFHDYNPAHNASAFFDISVTS